MFRSSTTAADWIEIDPSGCSLPDTRVYAAGCVAKLAGALLQNDVADPGTSEDFLQVDQLELWSPAAFTDSFADLGAQPNHKGDAFRSQDLLDSVQV